MKQLNIYTIATSLILTITAASYAQDHQSELTKHTGQSASEIAAVASNYFDANWTLLADSKLSQASTDGEIVDRADDYLNANWRINRESSPSAKADSRSYTDYFDANWSVFGRK